MQRNIIIMLSLCISPACYAVDWQASTLPPTTNSVVINAAPNTTYFHSFTIAPNQPNIVYASVDYQLFKSTDSAATWSPIDAGIMPSLPSNFSIAPNNAQVLYAITNHTLYQYQNNTWQQRSIPTGYPVSLAIDPINANILYVGASQGMLKSIDAGISWQTINLYTFASHIVVHPQQPNIIYALDTGLYKSTDAGETWQALDIGLFTYPSSIALDPTDINTVYLGDYDGVVKSIDGGSTWLDIDFSSQYHDVKAIAVASNDPNIIYTAGAYGVAISLDAGHIWSTINTGLASTAIHTIAIDPNNPYLLYAGSYDAGLQKHPNTAQAPTTSMVSSSHPIIPAASYTTPPQGYSPDYNYTVNNQTNASTSRSGCIASPSLMIYGWLLLYFLIRRKR